MQTSGRSARIRSYLINSIVIELSAAGDVLSANSVVHISLDSTRSHGVDGDLLVTEVDGHAAHEGLDGTLGARVHGVLGHTLGLAGDGPHENQTTADLEVVVRLAGDEELAARVDVEHAVELLGGDVLDVAERDDAAVGADDVQVAPDLLGLGEHLDDLVDVGDVGLDGDGVGAGLLDGLHHLLGGLAAVGVVHDDLGAATPELEGHLTTDTATWSSFRISFHFSPGMNE